MAKIEILAQLLSVLLHNLLGQLAIANNKKLENDTFRREDKMQKLIMMIRRKKNFQKIFLK